MGWVHSSYKSSSLAPLQLYRAAAEKYQETRTKRHDNAVTYSNAFGKGGHVFHFGKVPRALGQLLDAARPKFVDEFAKDQTVAQEILVLDLLRHNFPSHCGDPFQNLTLQHGITALAGKGNNA